MKQRIPHRAWYSPSAPAHHRRVLVEDDHPALAISDFSLFQEAGFDVAWCSGPGDDPQACPLLRGAECPVLARAHVVIHGLDPRLGVAAAIRYQCPETPVLAKPLGAEASVPTWCVRLPFACSVMGQIDAVRCALARRQGREGCGHVDSPD